MSDQSEKNIDELIAAHKATLKRAKFFARVQVGFIIACFSALAAVLAIKFMGGGGPPSVVLTLGVIGGLLGFGAVIPGRAAGRSYLRAKEIEQPLKRMVDALGKRLADESKKIPLAIGFANLSGEDLNAIASEDSSALSPLFARAVASPAHQIPSSQILFLYAHLNDDGTIRGRTDTSIRQAVQVANASIVVLASPNSRVSIQNAVALPGPKAANIVLTLDRNGTGFPRFFRELFEKMRDGREMLAAWVELAPQSPQANHPYAPQTVLLAEAGKLAFPRS